MDEGRRHGRTLKPAGRQPSYPRSPCPPDRRNPQRADRRIHALANAPLRGGATAAKWRACNADGPGSRPKIRPGDDRTLPGRLITATERRWSMLGHMSFGVENLTR